MGAMVSNFTNFTRVNGFPVLTRHISGDKPSREDRVTAVDRLTLAPDKFAVPKGFTEAAYPRE
jgi:hypothetical protein